MEEIFFGKKSRHVCEAFKDCHLLVLSTFLKQHISSPLSAYRLLMRSNEIFQVCSAVWPWIRSTRPFGLGPVRDRDRFFRARTAWPTFSGPFLVPWVRGCLQPLKKSLTRQNLSRTNLCSNIGSSRGHSYALHLLLLKYYFSLSDPSIMLAASHLCTVYMRFGPRENEWTVNGLVTWMTDSKYGIYYRN